MPLASQINGPGTYVSADDRYGPAELLAVAEMLMPSAERRAQRFASLGRPAHSGLPRLNCQGGYGMICTHGPHRVEHSANGLSPQPSGLPAARGAAPSSE